jgi:HEAT repeat protein
MMMWISMLGAALAGPAEDLALAASKGASDEVRMEAFERLVTLGATDMELVGRISQEADAEARQRWVAVRVLGQVQGDRSRNILIGLSKDPMPAIRAAASAAMGDFGEEAFVPYLVTLIQDPAVIVRAAAAQALSTMGDTRAVSALSDALQDKKNTFRGRSIWVRKYFVEALGGIGSVQAYPALLRAMDDPDETVSALVIPALEQVAGFSYKEGRTTAQEKEAWRRYVSDQLRR